MAQVLRPLEAQRRGYHDPNLLVGLDAPDDAAVYRISEETATILTTDFFTPIVDDPYDFGAIAAANAMSDVYAMGGEVLHALNVAALPCDLPKDVVCEILRGGAEKVAEAGSIIVGGHTVDSPEPIYGLVVLGSVNPKQIYTKQGARPGDVLFLTKPLGVGLVTTALKADLAPEASIAEAVTSMARLNRAASVAMRRVHAHAATDITGFSLLGHGYEMAEASGVALRFFVDALPFVNGVIALADEWLFPAGAYANEAAYATHVRFADSISPAMRSLLFTPETSGGLLIAMAPASATDFELHCATLEQPCHQVGVVVAGGGIEVI
ncbi:MAG: selenide, water dikinase SelD [Caldilineaceae bacterium]|nr:selenide, water dikinase SelD [Caldilineaceae bacterium]